MIRASRRKPSAATRTPLETLESRTLMSASIASAIAFGSNTTIGDALASVVKDAQGNTYAFGTFGGSFDANPGAGITTLTSNGEEDLFLIAYNSLGALLWAKSFGGSGHDYAGAMRLDASNNLVLSGRFQNSLDADPNAGTTTLTSNGGYDILLASFTTAGTLTFANAFGGTANDFPTALAVDATGNIYLGGSFSDTVDMDPGAGTTSLTANTTTNADTFVSKFDSSGAFIRTLQIPYDEEMTLSSVATDSSGNLFALGTLRGNAVFPLGGSGTLVVSAPPTDYAAYIAKYTSAGVLTWVKTYGDSQSAGFDAILTGDLTVDSADNLLLTGTFGGTVDFDPGTAVHTLAETQSPDDFTGYLLKLNNDGEYVFSGAFAGDSWSHLYTVRTDASNNIFVGGDFNGTIDFDLSAGTFTQSSNAAGATPLNTAFVAKYTPTGGLLWVKRASGGGNLSRVTTLAVGPAGQVAAGGEFYTSVSFDTTAGTQAFTSANFNDAFLLELTEAPTPSTLTLSPSNATRIVGQNLTLTATVLSAVGPGTPTGVVTFRQGSVTLGTGTLTNGVASLSFNLNTAGTFLYSASYSGDADFTPFTSANISIPVAANRAPIGSIDSSSLIALSGWTGDLDNPATALTLQVKVDGVLVRTLTAGNTRNDLLATVGGTNHGFRFQLPPMAAGTHTITLFAVDPISGQASQFATTTLTSNSLYFDEAWYLRTYADVAVAVNAGTLSSGWQHFQAVGAHEGRSPSAYFNETWYRQHNLDVAAAVLQGKFTSGFEHYINFGAHEGRDGSRYFHELYYRRANPDVATAITQGSLASGFQHFLLSGLTEGRRANPWFENSYYAAQNPDVVAAVNAGTLRSVYEHFVTTGINEGRKPSTLYVEATYLANNPDVADAVANHGFVSGFSHFINTGFYEGRLSDPTFDGAYYLSHNPSFVSAIGTGGYASAFQHYLLVGRLLGAAGHA